MLIFGKATASKQIFYYFSETSLFLTNIPPFPKLQGLDLKLRKILSVKLQAKLKIPSFKIDRHIRERTKRILQGYIF